MVAHTKTQRAIGRAGSLPWGNALKTDLKFFLQTTCRVEDAGKRNAVIMGRKTWDSIPDKFRPLAKRLNVVLSRKPLDPCSSSPLVWSRHDLRLAVAELCSDPTVESIFIIGGNEIYSAAFALGVVNQVLTTVVHHEFEGCDAFFPQFALEGFAPAVVEHAMQEEQGIRFEILRYDALPASKRQRVEVATAEPHEEMQYLDLVREILTKGQVKGDRTGTGTKSVFGRTMRFSLRDGVLPLLTTKRTFWRGVAVELLWFISGRTNAKELSEQGVAIWEGNSSRKYLDSIGLPQREEGDLGPVYGFQWRHFGAEYKTMHDSYEGQGVDQLVELIALIKRDPNSRRLILTAWNPASLGEMALPPCHLMCQFYVSSDGELSCQMYQRSADMGLGVPFNIASYALLTMLVAKCCGLKCGEFVHVIGDCHVYLNHEQALWEQLDNKPRPFPRLNINTDNVDITQFKFEHLELVGYDPHKPIKMDMAV